MKNLVSIKEKNRKQFKINLQKFSIKEIQYKKKNRIKTNPFYLNLQIKALIFDKWKYKHTYIHKNT